MLQEKKGDLEGEISQEEDPSLILKVEEESSTSEAL